MDKEPNDPTNDDLERAIISKRVLRLEERLDRLEGGSAGSGPAPHPAWPFALG
ncbi:MAG: hypothetical protein H6Q96_596, partial [Nitrospirae bacterium]|nr:hypothetical protein [Nitrospirota bacterium]